MYYFPRKYSFIVCFHPDNLQTFIPGENSSIVQFPHQPSVGPSTSFHRYRVMSILFTKNPEISFWSRYRGCDRGYRYLRRICIIAEFLLYIKGLYLINIKSLSINTVDILPYSKLLSNGDRFGLGLLYCKYSVFS